MQPYGALGGYRRHRMFIHQGLLVVVFEHNREIIEADYPALDRHAIRKVDGDTHLFFANLVQDKILQVIFGHFQ